ncbi:hypothetical protein IH601_04875 [Candidatus Bipolaricaulota bacterium]|nr:hypothetical protein [Candidatus Bipolaricaulota bacterium]
MKRRMGLALTSSVLLRDLCALARESWLVLALVDEEETGAPVRSARCFSVWSSHQATLAQLANCVFAHGKPHLRWDRG